MDRYSADGGQPILPAHTLEGLADLGPGEYEEALRAVAGQVVRQEIFAVDAQGRRAAHPYQVTQSCYRVRRVQPSGGGRGACFAVNLGERVTHDYEQQPDDPRVSHHLVLDVDPSYGNVLLECSIAYARRPSRPAASPAQQRHYLSVYRHSYVNRNEPDRYELGIAVESKEYETVGLSPGPSGLFRPEDLKKDIAPALATPLAYYDTFAAGGMQARLVDWDRSYYWDDAMTAVLTLGEVGTRTLLHHEESACFTGDLVSQVFGSRASPTLLRDDGGYVQRDGYWWQPAPVQHYESASGFFQLLRTERWDGATTAYSYDSPYYLTPVEIRDDLNKLTRGE